MIVRYDVPLGIMGAMLVHAAAESSKGTIPGTYAVVLSATDESALLKLEERLGWEQILHSAFREPDEPYNGALMAIGINPVENRRMVRKLLKGFKLLGS